LIARRVAAIHPFYTAAIREFEAAGRPIVPSGPVGYDGTAAWLEAVGAACGVPAETIAAAKAKLLPPIQAALARTPIRGRITVSGYEGSELLVARLLIESGADVPYVGTACPATPWSAPDRAWLEARGTHVQYRASLEQDLAALAAFAPDLAIGTTPVVQKAKAAAIPGALLHESDLGPAALRGRGRGIARGRRHTAMESKPRFEAMKEFFEGIGSGDTAGIYQEPPVIRPEFREQTRKALARLAKQRSSEAMI
jgi:chlorophyllide a reductase subunit Y